MIKNEHTFLVDKPFEETRPETASMSFWADDDWWKLFVVANDGDLGRLSGVSATF